MKYKYEIQKRHLDKLLFGVIILCLLFICGNASTVQAATKEITLNQYHPFEHDDETTYGDYYYELYPDEKYHDYKKFMKYTYKISDDSVIGIAINKDIDFYCSIITEDDKGNPLGLYPYDIKVVALGPGTSTLKVYNGTKLIDSYTFTVITDEKYSPSSFVNDTGENKLVKKCAKIAADSKYPTTNQRVLAVLDALVTQGRKETLKEKYNKWLKTLVDDDFEIFGTTDFKLLRKIGVSRVCATTNKAVFDNLGFRCTIEEQSGDLNYNTIGLYKVNEDYEEELKDRKENPELYEVPEGAVSIDELKEGEFNSVYFTATTELESDYDYTTEEPDSIYKRAHLPAWIIGEDTSQQAIDVGQTISLPSSDMNSNIFSSDTSVVTASDGKITGVKPGVAIVYRYNDTYCDVFFVLVSKKGSAKTVQTKVYTKSRKSYFATSDYAPYLTGGQTDSYQIQDWYKLRIYELEPVFGHGGLLKTEYSKGIVKCYVDYKGKSDLLCTLDAGH